MRDIPARFLLQRSQFAAKELGYFLRAQGVVASAIKTLKFATASFAEQEPLGLFALGADRCRCIFGHVTHAESGVSVGYSLSPITAEDGAVMKKSVRGRPIVVCSVRDSATNTP
jgi:hypothetical protein